MGRIEKLADRFASHITVPWQTHLAGSEKSIFVVYDKADERRLRKRAQLFELAARNAVHGWYECDLTRAFAEWMSTIDYREDYFQHPEDLALKLDEEFFDFAKSRVRSALTAENVDDQTIVGIFGIASLFGFTRVSKLMREVEPDIRGRIVVFFPGEYDNNNYRLLDARDGWNYLAVPITLHNGMFD